MNTFVKKIQVSFFGLMTPAIAGRLWVVPAVGIVWLLIGFGVRTVGLADRFEESINRYLVMEKQAAEAKPPAVEKDKAKKKSPFAPDAPEPPMPKCMGIIGDTALINDQWRKAGDTVDGATVVSVGASDVTILWKEKEQKLTPFDVPAEYRQSSRTPSPSGPSGSSESPQPVFMGPRGPESGGRGHGFMEGRMTGEEMAKMRDRIINMTPEERRAAFEEFRNRQHNSN